MTLKYESELLFDLMKRDGDATPSDVLPYESELKEKYLNQIVGAYPKVQDYRAEWLYYNLYNRLPSGFPVESVTNVTNASFNNVVPYAYKSAILKGQTLVNLMNKLTVDSEPNQSKEWFTGAYIMDTLKSGKYMLLYNVKQTSESLRNTPRIGLVDGTKLYHGYGDFNTTTGIKKWIFTATADITSFSYWVSSNTGKVVVDDFILLEYREGMENWDIPYFEGMQSVKMPVLTTTNADDTKSNILTCELVPMNQSMFEQGTFAEKTPINTKTYEQIKLGTQNLYEVRIRTKGTYKVVQGATYEVQLNDGYAIFVCFCKNGLYAAMISRWLEGARTTFTVPNDCDEMFFSIKKADNSAITPSDYSHIGLKIHQEVELRGVGDVEDELDCLMGQVTERIGEIVLDGSEDWRISGSSRPNHLRLYLITTKFKQNQNVINDKFADNGDISGRDIEGIYMSNTIDIQVEHSRLSDVSVDGFKEWLSNNNIKVQAMLASESIKTVELSCINEQGESETFRPIEGTMHVSTSSQTLPPLLDMSVPVEATSQNLASFANIVEEEK